MTVVTTLFDEKDYLRITKAAHAKGVKLATFVRIVMIDAIKDKEYLSNLEIPEGLTHHQMYKKKRDAR